MELFKKEEGWYYDHYNILGYKFTIKRPMPSEMSLERRTANLKRFFYKQVGYPFDVANPQTFNEKINWIKLFYRDDDMTKIVDKYEFKNYIKEKLGEGYTVPLLGVWDNVDDVDFDSLPNQFVLKCNAQSSGKFIKIVKDKSKLDIKALKKEMQDWLTPEKTLIDSYCWAYYNVPLRIIAEEYIEQIDGQVYDYKFMCFHGKPRLVLACCDRGQNTVYENHKIDWSLIVPSPKSATKSLIGKPKHFDEMLKIAKKLSAPFPFVRVDFYEIEDKVLLGEMTFYPNGGFNTYTPYWDRKFGSYIKLPKVKIHHPFFERIVHNRVYLFRIFGKKLFSYHKPLSNKELTKQLEQTISLLDTTRSSLKLLKTNFKDTKSELQTTKGELYTTIDELQTTKDDLQTTKDELHTTKDELKTTQTELQMTKDELHTAKNELNSLNKILQSAQSDIRNVQRDLRSRPKLRPGKMRLEERIEYLKYVFSYDAGYKLNLRNPQTFNEKICWMKLFYHNDELARIVDKYEFKNYIKEKLGDGYTVPLLGVWDNVDDIDFDKLPDQFVLKCNAQSDSKGIKIIHNKKDFDIDALKLELQDWLAPDSTLKTSFCWAYHNVPLKIIAEEYIPELENTESDYKFFCFHGEAKCFYNTNNWVTNSMHDNRTVTYYDMDRNPLPLIYNEYKKLDAPLEKIENFDRMVEIAQFLSKEFPFVRVDFYEINNKIFIGEMTFYPGGGYGKYEPKEWDYTLGSWLDLSKIPSEHLDVPDEYSAPIKIKGENELCSV